MHVGERENRIGKEKKDRIGKEKKDRIGKEGRKLERNACRGKRK